MKLVMRKSDAMEDWYVIEREEAPGEHREWLERLSGDASAYAYRDTARISDACVEGTADEMKAIAKAILAAGDASFRRCAVRSNTATVSLWSPRNSTLPAEVPGAAAVDLAKRMLAELES